MGNLPLYHQVHGGLLLVIRAVAVSAAAWVAIRAAGTADDPIGLVTALLQTLV